MVRREGSGVGFFKVIQKFSQAAWIFEKEPANHRLKSRGLPLKGTVLPPRSPARPIATAPDQALFPGSEMGLEPLQGRRLGFRPHLGHHLVVEITGAARGVAVLQPLVQFPDRIPQPGQLKDVEIGLRGQGGQS